MITLNNEQLEFLKYVIQDFEYNDNAERELIEQIETKIYNANEKIQNNVCLYVDCCFNSMWWWSRYPAK